MKNLLNILSIFKDSSKYIKNSDKLRLITLGDFSLDHSIQILRISNVSHAHSIESKTRGHTITLIQRDILDSWNRKQLFVANDFLTNSEKEKTSRFISTVASGRWDFLKVLHFIFISLLWTPNFFFRKSYISSLFCALPVNHI